MKKKAVNSRGGRGGKKTTEPSLEKVSEPRAGSEDEGSPTDRELSGCLDINEWKVRFREAFRQEDLAWRLFESDMLTAAKDPSWTFKSEHWRSFFQMRARRALGGLNGILTKDWVADGVMKDAERFFGKPIPSSRSGPNHQVPRAAEAIRDLSLHAAVLLLRAEKIKSKKSDDRQAADAAKIALDFLKKWHSLPHLRSARKNQRSSKTGAKKPRDYGRGFMDAVRTLILDSAWEHLEFWAGRHIDPEDLESGSFEGYTPRTFSRKTPPGAFGDPAYEAAWSKWVVDMLNDKASKGDLDRVTLRKRMPEIRRDVFPAIFNNFF